MAEIDEIKRDMITACRIMVKEGLVKAFGHFSARIPNTDRFLVSPRMSLALVEPEDLVTVNLKGERVEGDRILHSETLIHTFIYRQREDVNAIARTHSPMTYVFGVLGRSLRPIHDFGAVIPHEVPVFMKSELIRTEELARGLTATLGNGEAVLMRGNGTAVVGRSIKEACIRALMLEETAEMLYRALTIGEPIYFTEEEAQQNSEFFADPHPLNRFWDYYKSRISS